MSYFSALAFADSTASCAFPDSITIRWNVSPAMVNGEKYHLSLKSLEKQGGSVYSDAITITGGQARANTTASGGTATTSGGLGSTFTSINDDTSANGTGGSNSDGWASRLSTGGWAGIGVGSVAAVVGLLTALVKLFHMCWQNRQRRHQGVGNGHE